MKFSIGAMLFALFSVVHNPAIAQESINSRAGGEVTVGQPALPGQFASVVRIINDRGQTCTGTIVHPRLVVTAQHCVEEGGVWSSSATVYPRALSGCDNRAIKVGIADFVRSADYDLLAIRLTRDVGCVERRVTPLGSMPNRVRGLVIAGYGYSNEPMAGTSGSSLIYALDQTLASGRLTSNYFRLRGAAAGDFAGATVCHGDSGGPVFATEASASTGPVFMAGVIIQYEPLPRGLTYAGYAELTQREQLAHCSAPGTVSVAVGASVVTGFVARALNALGLS